MNNLIISDLSLEVENKIILEKISFSAVSGDRIAVIGPNGVGKSTFFKSIMSHFMVHKKYGTISLNGVNITTMDTTAISRNGIFYCPQNSLELDGVQTIDFLKLICKSKKNNISFTALYNEIQNKIKDLELPQDILTRDLNVNFSGGQKKKLEILQASLVNPCVYIIDEIDAGLDSDSIKNIALFLRKIPAESILIFISHNNEFSQLLEPNKVVVFYDKTIAEIGDKKIIEEIDKFGYKKYKKI
jgi:Fe-S cluster assembly ATP-binding protein